MKENLDSSLKKCKKCGESKPVDCFRLSLSKNKQYSYPRNTCKDCEALRLKQYELENKEKRAMQHKQYRERNIDKVLAREKEYREANKEKVTNASKKWRQENPEKVKERWKAEYKKNREYYLLKEKQRWINKKEELQAKNKAWREANPEKVKEYRRKYRLNIKDSLTLDYCEFLLTKPCTYCGGKSEVLDHIVPLSKGGTHTFDNLTPSCEKCNNEKKAKDLETFLKVKEVEIKAL